MKRPYLIVGAGFSGAVVARELAEHGHQVLVIDQRPHIAGNCHTERDLPTGVMEHVYGPHIFHTSNERVWNYIRRFGEMVPFVNRVKATTSRGVFSLPINLLTINQFFGRSMSPAEAMAFLKTLGDPTIGVPRNFEEQALKMLGRELYEAFFYGYTKKQWGCEPSELPASILKRLPVRFNYDDSYYDSKYQAIPRDGYTAIIGSILSHPAIEVKLGTPYESAMRSEFRQVITTGAIDQFYEHCFGRLGYRTVHWKKETGYGDLLGNAVMNYTELAVTHTRIHEHKHFAPWEQHEKSILFTEYSKETTQGDIPYYPKRLREDVVLLEKYQELAAEDDGVHFVGRLATYRYLDMHVVIEEALQLAERLIAAKPHVAVASRR